jgi:hypothetical protein
MQIAILVAFAMLILSFTPIYHVYSTTDEEAEQDEEEEQNGEEEETSQDGSPTVSIDPSSSDSLSVLSHRISTDEILDDPTMDIDGEIQNNGMVSLDFVRATVTFYDATNSILGSDFAYTEPTTLEPGQTAPFRITVGFGDNLPVDQISSIKLHISGR